MTARVDLWHWRLAGDDHAILSRDEVERANRFVFAQDRSRFIAGRAMLRTLLARYLRQKPQEIVFSYGEFGKPRVDGLHFNLSHTEDMAALAVSPNLPLGVDIETIKPIDLDVARHHFARTEFDALLHLPEDARMAAFYRCWTRSEAYLKARGTGLMTDLSSFSVTLEPGEPARLLRCESGDAAAWSLSDIAPWDGVAGALAVRTDGTSVDIVTHDVH